MKTTYYINGEKIIKKVLTEKIGAYRLRELTEKAKETYYEDPCIELDFFIGGTEMLTVEFS
ncbi:MAG: hypothetical protein LUH18_09315 [Oscillospiraceae bacterium]|nr:hypothetical protein [Oscillospiraceae bacterium]